ncbi:unnamed protein product [Arabis nemorensis]|uniref:Uncharacterized protein n=1 Tax=Arabis nemorensis TaxID=586526 RepID=A0A565CGM6_9BRAS|nr:unnamed protein product [Arabis nemorensis]
MGDRQVGVSLPSSLKPMKVWFFHSLFDLHCLTCRGSPRVPTDFPALYLLRGFLSACLLGKFSLGGELICRVR